MNREITFLIKVMNGGGAERVISLLSRAAVERGYDVSLVLTHQPKSQAMLDNIDKRIAVISLPDESNKKKSSAILPCLIMLWARILGKLGFTDSSSVLKYYSRNFSAVACLKKYFKNHKFDEPSFCYENARIEEVEICTQ